MDSFGCARCCAEGAACLGYVLERVRRSVRWFSLMPVRQPDHTVDFVPLERSLAASFPGRPLSGRLFDEELRRLLRSRLILVHLLSLAYVVLVVTFGLVMSRLERGSWRLDLYLAQNPHTLILAQSVVGVLVLWRSPAMSIKSLRLWELFHFTTLAVCYGYIRFWRLAFIAGAAPTHRHSMSGLRERLRYSVISRQFLLTEY